MPEPTEATQLAEVLGKSTDTDFVTVKEQTVESKPLTIDQISEIMLCLDRLSRDGVRLTGLDAKSQFSVTQLALKGGNDFRDIIAIATGQTSAFIGSLNVLEFAKVAGLAWRMQKDFFVSNQIEILQAFGLDESVVEEIKNLFASIKSLLNSSPAVSQTSDLSHSDKSNVSATPSTATTENKSEA